MKPLMNGWRSAAVCALLAGLPLAAFGAVACGQAPTSTADSNLEGAEMEILFPKMYSAYDGTHDFRIPAKVEGVNNVKWSADPADAVTLEKDDEGGVLITVKKYVKNIKIIAKAGPLRAEAPLTITEATADEWKEGDERYNNGVVWKRGEGKGKGDGGGGGKGERKVDPSLSCTNCHNKGGKGADVEHTPMQTAGFSDDELVKIFTEGQKPPGVKMRTTTKEKWQKMHQWKMEENEKKGIIVYLRSLEPEPQGEVDFGGRGKKRDEDKPRNDDNQTPAQNEDGGAGANTN